LLEHGAQCVVERFGAYLQQQIRATFGPLPMLFCTEPFAHDLVER